MAVHTHTELLLTLAVTDSSTRRYLLQQHPRPEPARIGLVRSLSVRNDSNKVKYVFGHQITLIYLSIELDK